ncbi:MAG TPA: GNAT family N-acetyltransferase [Candidatus Omnitrophota bacterium]|nr:GNAT family N-acetyltransferase [Candidatus Omnitrophota bacterium]
MKEQLGPDYYISDDRKKIDLKKVAGLLTNAYWSKGIKYKEVAKGANNSALIVAAFTGKGQLVAYSRVISDKTRFAYLLDVFVDEAHRRKGIGQGMVRFILNHPSLKKVYQWVLITTDAHGVYQKVGFKPLANPEKWMEIRHPRPEI